MTIDFDAATGPADVVGDITIEVALDTNGSATLASISSTGNGTAAAIVSGSVSADIPNPCVITVYIQTNNGRQTGIGLVGVGNNFIDPGETMSFSFNADQAPDGSHLTVTELALDPDLATADGSIRGIGGGSAPLSFSGTGRETFPVAGIETGINPGSGLVNNLDLAGGTTSRYQLAAVSFDLLAGNSGGSLPLIKVFTANPVYLVEGATSQLLWEVVGADSVSIEPLVGTVPPSGSVEVSPDASTKYTLLASNAEGTVFRSLRVNLGQPPNFLFIAIDDLKPICGFMFENPGNLINQIYPDPAVRERIRQVLTPNIDKLARTGTGFHRAYCPQSVCGPSRNAIMTGYRPRESGITANSYPTFRDAQFPDWLRTAVTLPQHLRDNGYVSAGTGKIYHTPQDDYADWTGAVIDGEFRNSWTMWFNSVPSTGNAGTKVISPWSPKNRYSSSVMEFGYETGPLEGQNDYARADFIARLLEEGSISHGGRTVSINEGKPFFLGCGIFRPHLPFYMPKAILDQFTTEDISATREMLDAFYADTLDAPGSGSLDSGDVYETLVHGSAYGDSLIPKVEDGGIRAYKETIRHYLAATALADRCVGRLLDALESSPYADNTVVVLWSDHGWYLGEKYLFRKTRPFDEAANCVLVIRDPRPGAHGNASGEPCYRTVSLQDLYPTIVSMAQLPVPDHVKGYDIRPLLDNPARAWNIPAQTSDASGSSIRYGEWSYIDRDGSIQLYHVAEDPDEIDNLAGDPAYASVQAMMADLLQRSIGNDPFAERDTDSYGSFRLGHWGWTIDGAGGMEDDPDEDRATNLLEYLFFGDPLVADMPIQVTSSLTDSGLNIAFPARTSDLKAAYHVQTSSNLLDWSTSGQQADASPGPVPKASQDGLQFMQANVPLTEEPLYTRIIPSLSD